MFDLGSLLVGLLATLFGIWMTWIWSKDLRSEALWVRIFVPASGVVILVEGLFLIAGTFGLVPMTGVQWYVRIPGR